MEGIRGAQEDVPAPCPLTMTPAEHSLPGVCPTGLTKGRPDQGWEKDGGGAE